MPKKDETLPAPEEHSPEAVYPTDEEVEKAKEDGNYIDTSSTSGYWRKNDQGALEFKKYERFVTVEQLHAWNDKGYPIETYGEDANLSVVMVGEQHIDPEQWLKQLELIRLIGPKYVLHEFLHEWMYNPKTQKFELQKGRVRAQKDPNLTDFPFGLPPKLWRLSREMGFPIIGCDLTRAEQEKEWKKLGIKGSTPKDEEAMLIRDQFMAGTTLEYQAIAEGPIVVVLGSDHGVSIHQRAMLQGKDFSYAYVHQGNIGNREEVFKRDRGINLDTEELR